MEWNGWEDILFVIVVLLLLLLRELGVFYMDSSSSTSSTSSGCAFGDRLLLNVLLHDNFLFSI